MGEVGTGNSGRAVCRWGWGGKEVEGVWVVGTVELGRWLAGRLAGRQAGRHARVRRATARGVDGRWVVRVGGWVARWTALN
ncbi:hypothetical protein HZH66_002718 [Vespula vulgaris]|uniref:Uncharacterized protein n=1 Tax=Vespula vulgaris TaxID=7454 RepID=A0A834KQ78_VESVU|nr:hypothetical protein HZH66_002718 [Vespula vulgaris]